MPYEQHRCFKPPTDPDIPIWRYMDFTRYVSLLDSGALHFARADQMPDRFEGSIPVGSPAAYLQAFRDEIETLDVHQRPRYTEERIAGWNALDTEAREMLAPHLRSTVYLSCWHMGEVESAAMWRLYEAIQGRGVAIRSTFRRLIESIRGDDPVHVGIVEYANFATAATPRPFDQLGHFLLKRSSFEFERELRAVVQRNLELERDARPVGEKVDTNLDRLVEAVYVAPGAPTYFVELVASLTRQYQRDWPVQPSGMDGEPVY